MVFPVSKLRQTKLCWFKMEFQIIWGLTLSICCSGNPLSCSITWLTAYSPNTFSCGQPVRKHHRHYSKVQKKRARTSKNWTAGQTSKIPKQTVEISHQIKLPTFYPLTSVDVKTSYASIMGVGSTDDLRPQQHARIWLPLVGMLTYPTCACSSTDAS